MNFNITPYNDSFDIDNKYYSVLFKPGYMVQARELNELQSQMQHQVTSLGDHLFKNDAKISGGSCSFIQYDRIKLEGFNSHKSNKITSQTGIEATIVHVVDDSLYVIYTKTATDNITSSFVETDVVIIDGINYPVEEVSKSLLFVLQEGVFYHGGLFLYTPEQVKVVEKNLIKDSAGNIVSSNTYRMCLDVVETVVDSVDDKSLLDPHIGYNNFGAPGADRYKVDLVLVQRTYYDDGSRTIVLAKVKQNCAIDYLKKDTEYADIMKMLAQRLYETYGDFCVKEWTSSYYNELKTSPTDPTGWTITGSKDHYVAVVQPGIGYIKGYRIETLSPVTVRTEKPRDTSFITKQVVASSDLLIDTDVLFVKDVIGLVSKEQHEVSITLDALGVGSIEKPAGFVSITLNDLDDLEVSYTINENSIDFDLGEEKADAVITCTIDKVVDTTIGKKELKEYSKSYESKPVDNTSVQELDHVDCVSLLEVILTDAEGNIISDITSEYNFIDGDTKSSYALGKIQRKFPRQFKDNERIVVRYNYFDHVIPGVFVASSYDNYDKIKRVDDVQLSNVIDLRAVGSTIETSTIEIEYYLPRIDSLLVNSNGEIYIKQGISADRPTRPVTDEDAMLLYEINLLPYCRNAMTDTRARYIDNKVRITSDINKINERVDKLEDAVLLSMLEQQTVDMTILDSTGKSRYKNGFIVDNFKTFNSADINNKEFKAGIDRNKGILRPSFRQDNIKLEFDESSSSNFNRLGNVVTSFYEHDMFISNNFATRTLSVNPYLTFRRTGVVALSPNIDTWSDDTILPEVNTTVDMSPTFNNVTVDSGSIDVGSWIDYNTSIVTSGKSNDTKMTQYSIDDIVKDVKITPYVRSKTIEIYAANLKPNTKIYVYFDGVNVTEHCRSNVQINEGAGVIEARSIAVFGGSSLVTDENGSFAGEFRIPANKFFTGEKTFVITSDPNNTGDVSVETTRATCSYFAGGVSLTKQTENMNIVTPIYTNTGSLKNNSTYFSRESNKAEKTFVPTDDMTCEDLMNYVLGYSLPDVYLDSLSGPFVVPNLNNTSFDLNTVTNSVKATIEKEIQRRIDLIKSFRQKQLDADILKVSSSCRNPRAEFDVLKARNDGYEKIANTWNKGQLSWTGYTTDTVKTLASKDIAARQEAARLAAERARDPIAQGFKVEQSCFISKVGVYFSQIDTTSDVIWFEIREMKNGYPVEESITHKEINSQSLVNYVSDDASKEYQVEFDVPVYIDTSRSYCFVIGGYTPDTRVYISTLGERLINSESVLEQPPLPYTMFRSLNGETWSAQQYDTLKLNMYRCVFDPRPLVVSLKSETDQSYSIKAQNNPFELQPNTTRVRVYANNHNLKINDRVSIDVNSETYYRIEVISGMPSIGQPFSTLTGQGYIKDIKITGTLNVYEISLSRVAGIFKQGQEFTCEARSKLFRDLVTTEKFNIPNIPLVQNQVSGFINNNPADVINSISGADISLFSKEHIIKEIDTVDSFIIEVEAPFMAVGRYGGNNVIIHDKNIKYDMINVAGQYLTYSAKESMTLTGYDIDNTEVSNIQLKHACDVELDQSLYALSHNNEKRAIGNNKSVNVNLEITTNDIYVGPVVNIDSFSATLISNRIETIDTTKFKALPIGEERYIQETHASDGVEKCKYVSNKVLLENPASDIKVLLAAHCPPGCSFSVYVKLFGLESGNSDTTTWTKLSNTISYTSIDKNDMIDYELSLEKNMTGWTRDFVYTGYRVKIVMNSDKSTRYPIIKDLRAIAIT